MSFNGNPFEHGAVGDQPSEWVHDTPVFLGEFNRTGFTVSGTMAAASPIPAGQLSTETTLSAAQGLSALPLQTQQPINPQTYQLKIVSDEVLSYIPQTLAYHTYGNDESTDVYHLLYPFQTDSNSAKCILVYIDFVEKLTINTLKTYLSQLTVSKIASEFQQLILRAMLTQVIITAKNSRADITTQLQLAETILITCMANGFNILAQPSLCIRAYGNQTSGILYFSFLELACKKGQSALVEMIYQLGHADLTDAELDSLFNTTTMLRGSLLQLVMYYQAQLPAQIEKAIVKAILTPNSNRFSQDPQHRMQEIFSTTLLLLHHGRYYAHGGLFDFANAGTNRLKQFFQQFWDEPVEDRSSVTMVSSAPQSIPSSTCAPGKMALVNPDFYHMNTVATNHLKFRFRGYVQKTAETVAEFDKHRKFRQQELAIRHIAVKIANKAFKNDHPQLTASDAKDQQEIAEQVSYDKIMAVLSLTRQLHSLEADNLTDVAVKTKNRELVMQKSLTSASTQQPISAYAALAAHRDSNKRQKQQNSTVLATQSLIELRRAMPFEEEQPGHGLFNLPICKLVVSNNKP